MAKRFDDKNTNIFHWYERTESFSCVRPLGASYPCYRIIFFFCSSLLLRNFQVLSTLASSKFIFSLLCRDFFVLYFIFIFFFIIHLRCAILAPALLVFFVVVVVLFFSTLLYTRDYGKRWNGWIKIKKNDRDIPPPSEGYRRTKWCDFHR